MQTDRGFQLFELIHKLTPREKSFFKRLHKANKADSARVALFDLINHQVSYSKSAIADFAHRRGVHVSSACAGLEERIIRSLTQYHYNSSPSLQLNNLLSEVELLYRKNLFDLVLKKIKQGVELADKLEEPVYSLRFRYWRLVYFFATEHISYDLKVIQEELKEIDSLCDELNSYLSIYHLSHLMDSILKRKDYSYTESTVLIQEQIVHHPILAKESPPSMKEGQYAYHDLVASSQYYLENWKLCLNSSDHLYQILRKPSKSENPPEYYRLAMLLTNLMSISNYSEDASSFKKYLKEFNEVISSAQDDKDAALIRAICIPRCIIQQMKHAIVLNNFASGEKIIKKQVLPLLKSDIKSPVKLETLMEIAQFYFHFSKFDECSLYCNQIFGIKEIKDDPQLFYSASWIQLIAYCKLDQQSLFESKWRSFQHYLKDGKGRDFRIEKILLSLLRKEIRMEAEERKSAYISTISELKDQLPAFNLPSRYFNICKWLQNEAEIPVC